MSSISSWPERERPRERLKELGPRSLSDAELLALVIGAGSKGTNAVDAARRILVESGGLDGISDMGLGAIERLPFVGEAKGARIIACLELGQRALEIQRRKQRGGRMDCSADVFERHRSRLGNLRQEVFMAVGLSSKNEAIRELVIGQGSVNECRVEPREVFRPLIAEAATRAVLLHNHPSGDSQPSPYDVVLTRRLARVGDLVGIPILDHIVIARSSYSSLRDLGLLTED
jgi:DNA repair protein RadC